MTLESNTLVDGPVLPNQIALDFAHAILESRLRDYDIKVHYVSKENTAVVITEPLHEHNARRLVEAIENIAKQLVFAMTKQGHKQLECSPLTVMSADVRIIIYATSEGSSLQGST